MEDYRLRLLQLCLDGNCQMLQPANGTESAMKLRIWPCTVCQLRRLARLNNVDVERLFYEIEPSNRDVSGACCCAVVAEGFFPRVES
jgi:hypothetical protein